MMPVSTSSTPYIAVDLFLQPQSLTALGSHPNPLDTVKNHMAILEHIVPRVSPVVLILVCPLASPKFDVHVSGLINILTFPVYTIRWNIVPGYTGDSAGTIYCTLIVLFFCKGIIPYREGVRLSSPAHS